MALDANDLHRQGRLPKPADAKPIPPAPPSAVHPLAPGGLADELAAPANDAGKEIIITGDRGAALLAKPPPVRWLCRDLQLAAGGRPMLFVAFGGSGKTWAALDVALAVATRASKCLGGVDLQGWGEVAWINFEMPRDEIIRRTQRLAWARKVPADAGGALEIISRVHLRGLTLTDARMKGALAATLKGRTLCVIDSFRASVGGLDENSSEIRKPLDDLLEVSDLTGCAFIVIHHEGKPGDNPREAIHRTRGSGAITDACDTTWHLVPGDHALRVEQGKVSLATKAEPFHVRLRDVGDIDPDTGRSIGLEVEWMPNEQIAQLEGDEPAHVRRARDGILEALGKHPTLTTNQIVRSSTFVRGKGEAKRRALGWLEADGLIEGGSKGWHLP
jgi:hypothetical protein